MLMRKKIITAAQHNNQDTGQEWLDLEKIAEVELTSENAEHPIEHALLPGKNTGWRAADPGEQTIRLIFNQAQRVEKIRLQFADPHVERTQEFVLRWSPDNGLSFKEIIRQQWNFTPTGATEETEEYLVELPAVTVLELIITPNISGGNAVASLVQLQLA
jgi:hypothetical protein